MEHTHHTQNALFSREWKYFVIIGLVTLVMGIIVMLTPIWSGMTLSAIIGAVIFFSGAVQFYQMFSIKGLKDKLWFAMSALLYIVGGLLILFDPLMGLITLTMLMVMSIVLNGLTRVLFGLTNRHIPGSHLLILSGIVSLLIGLYFFTKLDEPGFSLTLLGTFIGVSLLFEGISFISMGLRVKKIAE